jgi:hypothetical protein
MKDLISYYELSYNVVFVIQSLKEGDLATGELLYNDIIRWKCERNETSARLIDVSTKQDLFNFFLEIKTLASKGILIPILHFEMHGSKIGIELKNKEVITWQELGSWCREVNVIVKNQLVIGMATCMGAYFFYAINILERAPFWGYIGPKKKIGAGRLLEDFSKFYDIFWKMAICKLLSQR